VGRQRKTDSKPEPFAGDLVYSSLRTAKSNKPGQSVHLTLRFGQERFRFERLGITLADLYVGIRRAFLNFSLNDCLMPDEDWAVDPPIEVGRAISRTVGDSHSSKRQTSKSAKSSVGASLSSDAVPGGKLSSKIEVAVAEKIEQQAAEMVSDEFERTLQFVSARGGPRNPSWDIGCPPDDTILRGALFKDQHFCRVVATGDHPHATVSLEIPKNGLVIKDQTGAFDFLPNKRALTRMLLSQAFCKQPLLLIDTKFGEEFEFGRAGVE
jgi:hypothetical protein